MVCFQTKNPNLGTNFRALDWKIPVYFMSIWNVLWIFCDHSIQFVFVWYIFAKFWYRAPRKIWQPWSWWFQRQRKFICLFSLLLKITRACVCFVIESSHRGKFEDNFPLKHGTWLGMHIAYVCMQVKIWFYGYYFKTTMWDSIPRPIATSLLGGRQRRYH
jgi:hypothetical protein